MKRALGVTLVMLFIHSCETPAVQQTPAVAAVAVAPPPAAKPLAPTLPAECPVHDTVCTMDYSPMVCSAATYDGKLQRVSAQLIAWGPNSCAGRLNLQRLACSRRLQPSKMGDVHCVPDASGGHCPVAASSCEAQAVAKPTVCVANGYGAQRLSAQLQVKARGADGCLAMDALKREACRRNLDPDQLQQISCRSYQPKAPTQAPRPTE